MESPKNDPGKKHPTLTPAEVEKRQSFFELGRGEQSRPTRKRKCGCRSPRHDLCSAIRSRVRVDLLSASDYCPCRCHDED